MSLTTREMHNDVARAACAIFRALSSGLPFVKVGHAEHQMTLALRKSGELIEDPECENDFETLRAGIFQRFTKYCGDQTSSIYLPICDASEDALRDYLQHLEPTMPAGQIAGMSLEAALQSFHHTEAIERQDRRARSRAQFREQQAQTAALAAAP